MIVKVVFYTFARVDLYKCREINFSPDSLDDIEKIKFFDKIVNFQLTTKKLTFCLYF